MQDYFLLAFSLQLREVDEKAENVFHKYFRNAIVKMDKKALLV